MNSEDTVLDNHSNKDEETVVSNAQNNEETIVNNAESIEVKAMKVCILFRKWQ